MNNITYDNVTIDQSSFGVRFSIYDGADVGNVTFSNITIAESVTRAFVCGGGTGDALGMHDCAGVIERDNVPTAGGFIHDVTYDGIFAYGGTTIDTGNYHWTGINSMTRVNIHNVYQLYNGSAAFTRFRDICGLSLFNVEPEITIESGVTDIVYDGSDPVCNGGPMPPAQCSDGLDNDGDGLVDYPADPGCSDAEDESEVDGDAGGSFFDDFNDGNLAGWAVADLGGQGADNWFVAAGELNEISDAGDSILLAPHSSDAESYSVSVQTRSGAAFNDLVGVVFGYVDVSNYYAFLWSDPTGHYGEPRREIRRVSAGNVTVLASDGGTAMAADTWYELSVHVSTSGIEAQVDGAAVLTAGDSPRLEGSGLRSDDNDSGIRYDDFAVDDGGGTAAQCSDGLDNDDDGDVDYPADAGCSNPADNDESDDPASGGPVFFDDFNDGNFSDWLVADLSGQGGFRWFVSGGQLHEKSDIGDTILVAPYSSAVQSYTVRVRARSHATHNDLLGLVFGFRDTNNYYALVWFDPTDYYGESQQRLILVVDGVETLLDSASGVGMVAETWYDLEVAVTSGGIVASVDGQAVLSHADTPALEGSGLRSYDNDKGIRYDDFEILE